MFSRSVIVSVAVAICAAWCATANSAEPRFGRVPTPDEVALWNIDVSPDGTGLPVGKGSVEQGKQVYTDNCVACHGVDGQGGLKDRLAGGIGSLATAMPIKTIGSYWPYATTLYDYIRRAMPYQAPGSLSNDDYYALTAYLLNVNGIVPDNASLNQTNLASVHMPNRDGFVPEPEFHRIVNSRSKAPKAH